MERLTHRISKADLQQAPGASWEVFPTPAPVELAMVTIADVAEVLQSILTTTAETLAWETGFTQRASKLSGGRFVQTLVFGWLASPDASLAELAQAAAAAGVPVSPQALDQRFTEAAAGYLEQVLAAAVSALV